jgi:hypothetical protein
VRALDTRTTLGGHQAPVAPNSGFSLPIGGHAVPANAAAVIVTVSPLNPFATGTVTVWKAGTTRPGTANIALNVGRTMSDLAVVPLGTNGAISIWNNSVKALHLIIDVDGYVLGGSAAEGGTTTAGTPARALDTRTTVGGHPGALPAFGTYAFPIAGLAGVPTTNVTAVLATITVLGPAATGGVTAWADGGSRPNAGAMSFAAQQTTSALAAVPVGSDGKIDLYNNSAAGLQVVVDVAAYVRADRQPVGTSTSRYVRNLVGAASDTTVMHNEGCADAQTNNATRAQHVQLLHIGGQKSVGGTYGVQLSAISQTLTDAQLVTALNGYVDGYTSCRTGTDPVYVEYVGPLRVHRRSQRVPDDRCRRYLQLGLDATQLLQPRARNLAHPHPRAAADLLPGERGAVEVHLASRRERRRPDELHRRAERVCGLPAVRQRVRPEGLADPGCVLAAAA